MIKNTLKLFFVLTFFSSFNLYPVEKVQHPQFPSTEKLFCKTRENLVPRIINASLKILTSWLITKKEKKESYPVTTLKLTLKKISQKNKEDCLT